MLFKNMEPHQKKDEFGDESDDFYDGDFEMLNPFEFENDNRPKVARDMDKGGSILTGMAKLSIGILFLFGIYALLPGAIKFFFLLGKEFFNWVDKLF